IEVIAASRRGPDNELDRLAAIKILRCGRRNDRERKKERKRCRLLDRLPHNLLPCATNFDHRHSVRLTGRALYFRVPYIAPRSRLARLPLPLRRSFCGSGRSAASAALRLETLWCRTSSSTVRNAARSSRSCALGSEAKASPSRRSTMLSHLAITSRPALVRLMPRTRRLLGSSVRDSKPAFSRPATTSFMLCGVTKNRRDSSEDETGWRSFTMLSTVYCFAVIFCSANVWARRCS